MYLCVRGIDFTSFYDCDIIFWNCSDIVVCFVFQFIVFVIMKNWNIHITYDISV